MLHGFNNEEPKSESNDDKEDGLKAGDYVEVKVTDATSATLRGELVA